MKRETVAVGLAVLVAIGSTWGCSAPRAQDATAVHAVDTTPPVAATGARLPVGTVTDMEGRQVDVSGALRSGRTVVLVFWQTWCATCLVEAPELAAAARAHGDEILFVGVIPGPDGTVNDDEVRRLVKRFDLPYAQVRDRDLTWSQTFAVTGTPTLIALTADGQQGWRHHRPPADWSALHRQLRGLR